MNRQQFDFEFGKKHGVNSFQLTDNLTVFRKPLEIWNEETDESIKFKNIEELLNYKIDDKTVWELIEPKENLYGDLIIYGGRGSGSSNSQTFRMGASNSGTGKDEHLHPAEANVQIKTKTYESALKQFSDFAKDKEIEYAYEVDDMGFVHGFKSGGDGAVLPTSKHKNSVIIHNHPLSKDSTTSHFSNADMYYIAQNSTHKGIVATHYRGDHTIAYSVTKGGHFDATGFTKMIKKASKEGIKGKSYDDAVDKMLKANAKKYGYTYTKTKIKM